MLMKFIDFMIHIYVFRLCHNYMNYKNMLFNFVYGVETWPPVLDKAPVTWQFFGELE